MTTSEVVHDAGRVATPIAKCGRDGESAERERERGAQRVRRVGRSSLQRAPVSAAQESRL